MLLRTRTSVALAVLIVASGVAYPQASDAPHSRPPAPPDGRYKAQAAAFDKLSFMLGTWTGTGFVTAWNGTSAKRAGDVAGDLVIAKKMGGVFFTFDADTWMPQPPGQTLASSFSLLTYTPDTSAFHYIAYSGAGPREYLTTVSGKVLTATTDYSGQKQRFTFDFSSGGLHSVAELSTDGGKTWQTLGEMTFIRNP